VPRTWSPSCRRCRVPRNWSTPCRRCRVWPNLECIRRVRHPARRASEIVSHLCWLSMQRTAPAVAQAQFCRARYRTVRCAMTQSHLKLACVQAGHRYNRSDAHRHVTSAECGRARFRACSSRLLRMGGGGGCSHTCGCLGVSILGLLALGHHRSRLVAQDSSQVSSCLLAAPSLHPLDCDGADRYALPHSSVDREPRA
jgi:hypothetical protein